MTSEIAFLINLQCSYALHEDDLFNLLIRYVLELSQSLNALSFHNYPRHYSDKPDFIHTWVKVYCLK